MTQSTSSRIESSISVSPQIEPSWKAQLEDTFNQPYFRELKQFLVNEKKAKKIIYPAGKNIFAAFELTPWDKVKVVILGQDPYHGVGQAHGLAFSVPESVPLPPSLHNIYKELFTDLGIPLAKSGNLSHWAEQGVLLLNTVLTVEAGQAYSHRGQGWEIFTDYVIKILSERKTHLAFVLWGASAQQKAQFIDTNQHFIVKSAHPSPLSSHRGFFGSKPFSKINQYLESQGKVSIRWGGE